MNHGLIPGGVSLRTGRQAEFFTVVNPMDNQDGGNLMRLVKSKNRDLETLSGYSILVNLKLAQQRGLRFYTKLFSTTHCLQSSLRKRYA